MIERAHADQAPEILAVINSANRAAYSHVIPREHFRDPVLRLEQLLALFERATFFVYMSEARIVATAALQVEGEGAGRIDWVYVLPEHQRRGIGSALLTRLELEAVQMGLRRLRLYTAENATWAVRFYTKRGYRPTRRVERAWGFDLRLEKDLPTPGRA